MLAFEPCLVCYCPHVWPPFVCAVVPFPPKRNNPIFPKFLESSFEKYCVVANASRSGGSSLVEYESHGKDTPPFCMDLSRSDRSPGPFDLLSSFPVSISGGAAELGGIPFYFLIRICFFHSSVCF
jgi:hypothetical protein